MCTISEQTHFLVKTGFTFALIFLVSQAQCFIVAMTPVPLSGPGDRKKIDIDDSAFEVDESFAVAGPSMQSSVYVSYSHQFSLWLFDLCFINSLKVLLLCCFLSSS